MSINPYFSQGRRSEQKLYEDLVVESLKIYGQDVYYLPRTQVNFDTIFRDDIPSQYGSNYRLEMYIENVDGFDGEGDLFTKFGVEIRDQANFVMSRQSWNRRIKPYVDDSGATQYYRPKEGDLIYLPLSQSIFIITKVEDESPFYQLKNLPVFRMTCELFEYNDQDLDTGIDAIDKIEETFTYQYALTLGSVSGTYVKGETVNQILSDSATMSGEVQAFSDSDNILYIAHAGATDGKYHDFTTGITVTGATSNATGTPSLVSQLQNIQDTSQNDVFDGYEVQFIDFSESNPFGDAQ